MERMFSSRRSSSASGDGSVEATMAELKTTELVPPSASRVVKAAALRFSKRPRTTTLQANLAALGRGNKSLSSPIPASNSLMQLNIRPRRLTAAKSDQSQLVSPPLQISESQPKSSQDVLNLDDLRFSDKCYMPLPVRITDYYTNASWTPVPINEQTVRVPSSCEEGGAQHKGALDAGHEQQDFYHREVPREEVLCMFQRHGNEPGLCLVRDSTRIPGHFALTVWEGQAAVNYRIEFRRRNGRPQYLLSGKTVFGSIAEILLFLHRHPQFFPAAPTAYIPRVPDGVKDELYSTHFCLD